MRHSHSRVRTNSLTRFPGCIPGHLCALVAPVRLPTSGPYSRAPVPDWKRELPSPGSSVTVPAVTRRLRPAPSPDVPGKGSENLKVPHSSCDPYGWPLSRPPFPSATTSPPTCVGTVRGFRSGRRSPGTRERRGLKFSRMANIAISQRGANLRLPCISAGQRGVRTGRRIDGSRRCSAVTCDDVSFGNELITA